MASVARKFDLGQVIITPTAADALAAAGQTADAILARHQAGDWGDVGQQERTVNEQGLAEGLNLVSVYAAGNQRISVVTKGDRLLTLVHVDPRRV